jgi:hypothetical protein
MEGGQEGFVVGEDGEGAALEGVPEVKEGGVEGLELPVKGGVALLGGVEFA